MCRERGISEAEINLDVDSMTGAEFVGQVPVLGSTVEEFEDAPAKDESRTLRRHAVASAPSKPTRAQQAEGCATQEGGSRPRVAVPMDALQSDVPLSVAAAHIPLSMAAPWCVTANVPKQGPTLLEVDWVQSSSGARGKATSRHPAPSPAAIPAAEAAGCAEGRIQPRVLSRSTHNGYAYCDDASGPEPRNQSRAL